jgi:hypothetical protein
MQYLRASCSASSPVRSGGASGSSSMLRHETVTRSAFSKRPSAISEPALADVAHAEIIADRPNPSPKAKDPPNEGLHVSPAGRDFCVATSRQAPRAGGLCNQRLVVRVDSFQAAVLAAIVRCVPRPRAPRSIGGSSCPPGCCCADRGATRGGAGLTWGAGYFPAATVEIAASGSLVSSSRPAAALRANAAPMGPAARPWRITQIASRRVIVVPRWARNTGMIRTTVSASTASSHASRGGITRSRRATR